MADATVAAKSETAVPCAKQEVRALLDRLPDGLTLEQIQYHLDVVVKVLAAERNLAEGHAVSQAEFDKRFARWLTK